MTRVPPGNSSARLETDTPRVDAALPHGVNRRHRASSGMPLVLHLLTLVRALSVDRTSAMIWSSAELHGCGPVWRTRASILDSATASG